MSSEPTNYQVCDGLFVETEDEYVEFRTIIEDFVLWVAAYMDRDAIIALIDRELADLEALES